MIHLSVKSTPVGFIMHYIISLTNCIIHGFRILLSGSYVKNYLVFQFIKIADYHLMYFFCHLSNSNYQLTDLNFFHLLKNFSFESTFCFFRSEAQLNKKIAILSQVLKRVFKIVFPD